jgi:hypothetical protein
VLFRFALAFLKYAEEEITLLKETNQIFRYMRNLGIHINSVKRITNVIIIIIIIILDAIYALFLKSSKRGALYQHERSRVTHNTQPTLNTYMDKHKHTRGPKAGRTLLGKRKGNQIVFF